MNIEQLKSIATVKESFVKRTVEYTPIGQKEPVSFDVFIKQHPSVADFEAIQGLSGGGSHSYLVEQVVRLVRFGDDQQAISEEDAASLDYRLLMTLGQVIRSAEEEVAAKKGGSAPKTKS